jgi:hypothetical protein
LVFKEKKNKERSESRKEEREARGRLGGGEGNRENGIDTSSLRHIHGQELEMATFELSFLRAAIKVCCSKSE